MSANFPPANGYATYPQNLSTGFLVPDYGTEPKRERTTLVYESLAGTKSGRIKSDTGWSFSAKYKSRRYLEWKTLNQFHDTVDLFTPFNFYDIPSESWYVVYFNSRPEGVYQSFDAVDFNISMKSKGGEAITYQPYSQEPPNAASNVLAGWQPNQLPDLRLWYDMRQFDGLGSGTPVSQIIDTTGNYNTNALTNTSQMGIVVSNARNSHAALNFSGSGKGYLTALTLSKPYTIILIEQSKLGYPIRTLQSVNNNRVMAAGRAPNGYYLDGDLNVAATSALNATYLLVPASGNVRIRRNKTELTSIAQVSAKDWGVLALGASGSYNEQPDTNLYQILVCTSVLSNANCDLTTDYFDATYGIL